MIYLFIYTSITLAYVNSMATVTYTYEICDVLNIYILFMFIYTSITLAFVISIASVSDLYVTVYIPYRQLSYLFIHFV